MVLNRRLRKYWMVVMKADRQLLFRSCAHGHFRMLLGPIAERCFLLGSRGVVGRRAPLHAGFASRGDGLETAPPTLPTVMPAGPIRIPVPHQLSCAAREAVTLYILGEDYESALTVSFQ